MKTATFTQLIHIIKHESLEDGYKAARELMNRPEMVSKEDLLFFLQVK